MMAGEQDYVYTDSIKDLQKRLETMFKNHLYGDTYFTFNNDHTYFPGCGGQGRFRVTSDLVAVASRKLYSIMREHFVICDHRVIQLDDVKCVESFTVIMKYVYGLDINFSQLKSNVLCEAIHLAEVYQLDKFSNDLKEFLSKVDKFQLDLLAVLLNTARKYNLNVLYGKLKLFAFENAENFIKHESIVSLQNEILLDLVKSNWFYAPEIDILMGVLNWYHRFSTKETKETLDNNVETETNVQNEDINGDTSSVLKSLLVLVRIKQISRLDHIKLSKTDLFEAYKHILGENEHFSQTSVVRCNYKTVVGEIKILSYASGKGGAASRDIPVAPFLQDGIRIYVRTLSQRAFTLYVKPSDTIASIKVKIEILEGILIDLQRLIFENQQLENEKIVSDYNIQAESTLYFVLRLRGG